MPEVPPRRAALAWAPPSPPQHPAPRDRRRGWPRRQRRARTTFPTSHRAARPSVRPSGPLRALEWARRLRPGRRSGGSRASEPGISAFVTRAVSSRSSKTIEGPRSWRSHCWGVAGSPPGRSVRSESLGLGSRAGEDRRKIGRRFPAAKATDDRWSGCFNIPLPKSAVADRPKGDLSLVTIPQEWSSFLFGMGTRKKEGSETASGCRAAYSTTQLVIQQIQHLKCLRQMRILYGLQKLRPLRQEDCRFKASLSKFSPT
nr:uncharacterized protein LOC114079778 [Marmota flaviventris]